MAGDAFQPRMNINAMLVIDWPIVLYYERTRLGVFCRRARAYANRIIDKVKIF